MRLILSLLAVLAAPALATEPLKAFPDFEEGRFRRVLVVADLKAGHDLPQSPECNDPDVICMDPPPFVLDATVLAQVHGDPVPAKLQAATTSHQGKGHFERAPGPYLVRLRTDGSEYVMDRYAVAHVVPDRVGQWHVIVDRAPLPWWLPCSVEGLKREFVDGDFASDLEIPNADFEYSDVGEHPELFRLTATGAMPRYSIPVAALREHLAALPADAPLDCEAE